MKIALLAVLLLSASWSVDARAGGDAILLVVDPGSPGAGRRVEAELTAAGFTVVTRASSEPTDRGALLEDARRADAVATVRVHARGSGAELCIIDRVTGKTVFRDVDASEATDDATLATKATELLRASFLEVHTRGFRPTEVPVPGVVDELDPPPPAPTPPEPRGFVGLGGTVGAGGALGALGFVSAELRVRLARVLATGAVVTIPVTQSSFEAPQGSSSQLVSHASVVLDAAPLGFTPRLAPFVGVTAGILWFHTSGTAISPYASESADVFSTLLGFRGGAALRLTSALAVRAQVAALASIPQPTVVYAGRSVGSLAEPLLEATVGLELVAW